MLKVKCAACGFVSKAKIDYFKERDLGNGIKDIGALCPKCGKWYHSYYMNRKLEKMRKRLKDNSTLAKKQAYKLAFDKLQDKMKAQLNENN